MKILRWIGLIGFLIFMALLVFVGFFFIDNSMKRAIESSGMNLNGAEVNVDRVDFTLSPLGFNIEGIQIANPEQLDYNSAVISQLRFDVNLVQLFLGNVDIQNLIIAGVDTDVKRSKPAKLAPIKTVSEPSLSDQVIDKTQKKLADINAALPTPAEVAERHTRRTTEAVLQAQATLIASKDRLSQSTSELPNDQDLAAYKTRIDTINKAPLNTLQDVIDAQKLIDALKTDVEKDKSKLDSVRTTVNQSVQDSQRSVNQISVAAGDDWAELKAAYPLNVDSVVKMSKLLLGERFFEHIETAKYWYLKATPLLNRLKIDAQDEVTRQRLVGQFVRFYDPDPTAAFQLDNGLISFVAGKIPWSLSVTDVTSELVELSPPVNIQLRRGEEGPNALLVSGALDIINGQRVDDFKLSGNGLSFSPQQVDLGDAIIDWVPEKASVSGQLTATDGNLKGLVTLQFPTNRFTVEGASQVSKVLRSTFSNISSFKMNLKVSGTVRKPNIAVESDLDNQFNSVLANYAKEETALRLAELKSTLDREVLKLRQPANEGLSDLSTQKESIQQDIDRFENEVNAEVNALEEKVAAQRAAIEAKAKKAAEDKVKSEVLDLKNKIKF